MSFDTALPEVRERDLAIGAVRPSQLPPPPMRRMGVDAPHPEEVDPDARAYCRKAVLKAAKTGKATSLNPEKRQAAGWTERDERVLMDRAVTRHDLAKSLARAPKPADVPDPGPPPDGGKVADVETVAELWDKLWKVPELRAQHAAEVGQARTAEMHAEMVPHQIRQELARTADPALARALRDLRRQADLLNHRIDLHAPAIAEQNEIAQLEAKLERLSRGELLESEQKPRTWQGPWEAVKKHLPGLSHQAAEKEKAARQAQIDELYRETRDRLRTLRARKNHHAAAVNETRDAQAQLDDLAGQAAAIEAKQLKPENMDWTT